MSSPVSTPNGVVKSAELENVLEAFEPVVPPAALQHDGDEQTATKTLSTSLPMAAYDTASWAARVSFGYASRLLRLGQERTLQTIDLDPLPQRDQIDAGVERLSAAWTDVIGAAGTAGSSWLLWRALYRSNRGDFWKAGAYCFGESFFCILQPVLLGEIIWWLQNDAPAGKSHGLGLVLALALAFASFAQAVVHHQLYMFTMRGGFNMRMAVSGMIHAKLMRLSNVALTSATTGKIINLVSNDVQRFDQFSPAIHFLWSAPMDLIAIAALVTHQVGAAACFAGISIVLLSVPLQAYFGRLFGRRRRITAQFTDRRVATATEICTGMLSIKALGWLSSLSGRIAAQRRAEHASILVSQSIKALNLALHFVTPAVATFVTFATFWATGGTLTLFTVFSTMSLLHALRLSFGKNWRRAMESGPEAHVAVQRIQRFLLLPECGTRPCRQDGIRNDILVDMHNCSFSFSVGDDANASTCTSESTNSTPSCVLSGMTFRVSAGQLALVLGPVGCGKSSLLLALCGELKQCNSHGRLHVDIDGDNGVAYSSQDAWIFSGSLKQNILFGADFDSKRFQRVVFACALEDDIALLSAGTDTEIGERGINLSGGQRARVSLARAAYATLSGSCRVVLLDDPLAAVDVHVAKHIFEHCICGVLLEGQNTCVVMATHHQHLAPRADVVVQLSAEGTMDAPATYSASKVDAPAMPTQAVAEAQTQMLAQEAVETQVEEQEDAQAQTQSIDAARAETKLVVDEERAIGRVTRETYLNYAQEGGAGGAFCVLLLFGSGQACVMFADYWLKIWATSNDQNSSSLLVVYVALALGTVAICLLRAMIFFTVSMRASSSLHNSAFAAVLAAPMSFFISHPTGRIMNKFSSDQGEVDELLPVTLYDCMQCAFLVFGSVVLGCVAVPWLLLILLPLVWLFMRVRNYYLGAALDLKRLDQRSKSPIFAFFSASISGVGTIRAYARESQANNQFVSRLQANGRAWFAWLICNRWVGFRLDMLSTAMLASICIFAVELAFHSSAASSFIDPGLIGLSLVYAISLSGTFQYMVRQSAAVETMMSSVQRLLYYKTSIPIEGSACYFTHGSEQTMVQRINAPRVVPEPQWPQKGSIEVKSLRCRYRHDLPEVLKGVSFSVQGGEKIGIVGRTGSGKSSFINALLRLNEVTHGCIAIDGVDSVRLDLQQLRSGIAFIPQDPHLFAGSLRFNLDPVAALADEELWSVLELVNMADFVRSKSSGLLMNVAEGGSDLSIGQRQLISLARAVLRCRQHNEIDRRAAQIICMDEATANIDYSTDELIQKTLRRDNTFGCCTLIIVAHRISTVLDADRIVVLEDGRVLETGLTEELLAKPNSAFAAMVAKHSESSAKVSAVEEGDEEQQGMGREATI